jgi:hypothetical protein
MTGTKPQVFQRTVCEAPLSWKDQYIAYTDDDPLDPSLGAFKKDPLLGILDPLFGVIARVAQGCPLVPGDKIKITDYTFKPEHAPGGIWVILPTSERLERTTLNVNGIDSEKCSECPVMQECLAKQAGRILEGTPLVPTGSATPTIVCENTLSRLKF